MRISDWSSDVCSSDLDLRNRIGSLIDLAPHVLEVQDQALKLSRKVAHHLVGSAHVGMDACGLLAGVGDQIQDFARVLNDIARGRVDPLGELPDLTGHHGKAQIGRAHAELQSLMRISYAVSCLKKQNEKKKDLRNT